MISRCLRKDPERRFGRLWRIVRAGTGRTQGGIGFGHAGFRTPAGASPEVALGSRGYRFVDIGASVLWLVRSATKTPQVAADRVPLTSYPGSEDRPTFSPDGSQVAFVWNGEKQDNDDIYVKLIGPGASLRLTTDPARDYSPAWAPDGSSIAFLRDLPGGRTAVLLVPPIGGTERKLAETSPLIGIDRITFPSSLAWSPDGSSLAIVDRSSPNEPFQIFLLSVETGERRKLTSPPPDGGRRLLPAFSPDGGLWHSYGYQVLLVIFSSASFRAISIRRANRNRFFATKVVSSPTWTLDGREIISAFGTVQHRAACGGLRPTVPETSSVSTSPEDQIDSPSLSRQRNRLAYTPIIYDYQHVAHRMTGTRQAARPPVKFGSSTRNEVSPSFHQMAGGLFHFGSLRKL